MTVKKAIANNKGKIIPTNKKISFNIYRIEDIVA
jgi:hypothetical protein